MTSIVFAPASSLSLEGVTAAFNLGFAGYYLPMAQTPDGLAQMMRENDVRLDDSAVLYINDALAGVGLVGVREARGWIAGMGVAPEWRGQGIGARLLERLLTHMRAIGVRRIQLEALDVNTPALSLYGRLGFRTLRSLVVYHGPLRLDAPDAPDVRVGQRGDRRRLRATPPRLALSRFAEFHGVAPAGQRARATLERARGSLDGLGLWDAERLSAYLLFSRQSGGYAILDAGADAPTEVERRDDIVRLVRALVAHTPEAAIRVINSPPGDPLGAALDLLRCPVVVTQREMVRDLT